MAFLSTVGQAVDDIVGVAAIEEWNRVSLFTRLIDDAVQVRDIFVVGPAHEHVAEVDHIRPFHRNNLILH